MSVNNIYVTVDNPPYKRFKKTIPSKLAGIRLNADGTKEVAFILETPSIGESTYDDEVLEIYSDREFRFFKQRNKAFFESGLLKEVNDQATDVSTVNMLTDEDVESIAAIRNSAAMLKKLQTLTSRVAVDRVLQAATDIGRPKKTLDMIKEYSESLNA